MMKQFLCILTLFVLFLSCSNKQDENKFRLQLLRVGGAACRPINEINKGYGASYYFDYTYPSDSLGFYICMINSNGEPEPESTYYLKVDSSFKETFYNAFLFSDSINSGIMSSLPLRGEGMMYCGGVFVLSISKENGQNKYYTFIQRENTPFEVLVDSLQAKLYGDRIEFVSNQEQTINIDSIVGAMLSYKGFDSAIQLPAPLKTTVKFTPPEIEEE